jgi:hypothetical protein
MSYERAKNCFNENISLFANPQSQPEKYNLYNGLTNLTNAIETDLGSIKDLLEQILWELREK